MEKNTSNKLFIFFLGVILLSSVPLISFAQVPRTVSYQGYLTDTGTGNPVDSSPGTVSIVFTIYDALTGGASQWTETQNVAVNQGVYSVIFGSVPANPLTAAFDREYYLQIDVETTPGVYETLLPRQALTSVPYALNADTANHANTSGNADTLDSFDSSEFAQLIALNTSGSGIGVHWGNLTTVPAGLNDGDDDTTYSAGTGLNLVGTTFNVNSPLSLTASDTSGTINGVNNHTVAGYGVYGLAIGSSAAGVHGRASGSSGHGVNGNANATGAVINYGGYFTAQGDFGRGVYGRVTGSSGYGVYGQAHGSGTGGYFTSTSGYGLIVDNGNVGIGTTTPTEKLSVSLGAGSGTIASFSAINNSRFSVSVNGVDSELSAQSGNNLKLGTFFSGTSLTLLNSNGNVGIGTTSPAQKLDVAGTVQITGFKMPTGASNSYVLTSDSFGVGTWQADITGVTAGTGLSGGGTSGSITLNVSAPLQLSGTGTGIVKGTDSSGNYGYLGSSNYGVYGYSGSNYGVYGYSNSNYGVFGSSGSYGVRGNGGDIGVYGTSIATGVHGSGAVGVYGNGSNQGVSGYSSSGYGVYGNSDTNYAGFFPGAVYVSTLAKGSGTFVQPHTKYPSKEIQYAFFEGPEHAVFLRGTAQLKGGKAVIDLPEHFRVVAAKEGVQVQVTPIEDCNGIFVKNKSRDRIEIKELMNGKSNAAFDYFITAIRSGFEEHKPVVANTHFKPEKNETAEEFERRFSRDDMTAKAMRSMLISNGILTEDGKLNMALVKELGWTVAEEKTYPDNELSARLQQE